MAWRLAFTSELPRAERNRGRERRSGRFAGIFYGWWIVAACGTLQFLGAGFYYYGLGSFFLPITAKFGWPRAITSSAFSAQQLLTGALAPVVGFAFDRVGSRKLAIFGVTLLGVGFLVLSQAAGYGGFVAAALIMAAGYGCAFTANTMATVANWFARKRTIALGYVMAASGSGGLLVPALAWVLATQGGGLARSSPARCSSRLACRSASFCARRRRNAVCC